MLKTPRGEFADHIDRTMLLAMWTDYVITHKTRYGLEDIYIAGIGRPTYPINLHAIEGMLEYWNALNSKRQHAAQIIARSSATEAWPRTELSEIQAVVGYGDPVGEFEIRKKMAVAMSNWYKIPIKADNILFNVGGAGALYAIFDFIAGLSKSKIPIVTTFPHYSLYTWRGRNRLVPIDLFKLSGYRLTGDALRSALLSVQENKNADQFIESVFLLCDPHNPLGIALREKELEELVDVLCQFPKTLIVIDEAYAEMRFVDNIKISLLSVAYQKHPEMLKRFVVMRSATKALSAPGERMAITLTFDSFIMQHLLNNNIDICGHAPISHQYAYTAAMQNLSNAELTKMREHYKPQVDLVYEEIQRMGLGLPDKSYRPDATFYAVINLSQLLGRKASKKMQEALSVKSLETDEAIAYYLLFEYGIMINPLSYFGADPKLGYLRITCVGGDIELKALMNKLKNIVKAK